VITLITTPQTSLLVSPVARRSENNAMNPFDKPHSEILILNGFFDQKVECGFFKSFLHRRFFSEFS
jgi:hypothetical protein